MKKFFSQAGLPFLKLRINHSKLYCRSDKTGYMKKILWILGTVVVLAACNNEGTSSEEVQDSVLEKIDSTGEARVDSVKEATDSLSEKVENTFEKTDSANKVLVDSAK